MSDVLDATGLTLKTLSELREELVGDLKDIYGDDINVDQNSQDGQSINIYCQGGIDIREVVQKVYTSFDPDEAEGRILDQRVGINGIERNSGTYTYVDITFTIDRSLNLVGLDDQADELEPTVTNLYTVKDDAGNEFYLLESQNIIHPTTEELTFTFRAKEIGIIEVTPLTITTPVTIVAGVLSITNTSSANSVGVDEESDFDLKRRRRGSVALSASGYLDSIEAAILNVDDVTDAVVHENDTDSVDGDGIPAHSIWCIVEGGDDDEIALAIYKKKSSGSGMKGDTEVYVPRTRNRTFLIRFDRVENQDLYIRFSITYTGGVYDPTYVKQQIVQYVLWEMGKDASTDEIISFVKSLNEDYIITGCQISDDGASWAETQTPSSKKHKFINDTARITIT
jgi:uncharacterized phage protein gp47/JayE